MLGISIDCVDLNLSYTRQHVVCKVHQCSTSGNMLLEKIKAKLRIACRLVYDRLISIIVSQHEYIHSMYCPVFAVYYL